MVSFLYNLSLNKLKWLNSVILRKHLFKIYFKQKEGIC